MGNPGFRITVSVSPHVPKPHTPFAWAEQVTTRELNRRLGVLREAARGRRVTLKYRDAETSMLEGVFTRGDRRLCGVVEDAFRRGCRFDAWSEHLKYDTWLEVFRDHGMDPERALGEHSTELDQPWDVVQSPVTKKFLVREWIKAGQAGITEDCRLEDVCFSCGVVECPQRPWVKQPHAPLDLPAAREAATGFGRRQKIERRLALRPSSQRSAVTTSTRFRIMFHKSAEMRFTSHLDLMRTYSASAREVLWKLRLPASLPFLFTSMKVAIAASLVGAIVAELPTGAVAGIGAKLLLGSYYSQTIQLWSALIVGSVMAGLLVAAVGIAQRIVQRRMGTRL